MTFAEARIHELNANVACIQVEVEGMKARNLERERRGEALAYNEEAFQKKADQIQGLANLMNEFAGQL